MFKIGITFCFISSQILNRKGGDYMLKINYMSTLFIGIDVASKSNVVCAMDFYKNQLIKTSVSNNQPGAYDLICQIVSVMQKHTDLNTVVVALEATSIYSVHISNYLSSCEELMPYHPYVFCLNPKMTANYRKSFIGMNKTDPLDAFIIADFARAGRIESDPWRGSQFLALQRLTRHRLHLVEALTREKTYMVSNIFLKFSELSVLPKEEQPFCNNYGFTASSVLTEFLSMEDIINASSEKLVAFLGEKSRNRIANLDKTADLLQKAARNSYRLDKCLYDPINISLASSFNCINAFKQEIKTIDNAIHKTIAGLNPNAYTILTSIDGIGPVFAAGILAEIGDISAFYSQDALAKYAGLTWTKSQSGNFEADESRMTKAGNRYLRYYLGEAANSMKNHVPEYRDFYNKKYNEVPKHKHKRALALTSRKLVRLIFGLLTKEKLYSTDRADTLS